MDYSDYKAASGTVMRNKRMYRWLGHTPTTCVHYSVYVAEGFVKNAYNTLKSIPDWRTEDPEGAEEKLPPLADGWQQFYIRNLYGNIEDTFNRPIESSPDGWIDVTMRERTPNNGYFSRLRNTGSSRRCLNLGSYNYLGFGGVNSYCTPKVEEAMRNLPIALGSSSAELGHSQEHIELETLTARFVGKEAAFVVGMGFATNSLVLPAIVGKNDLIISDEQNHKSIAEGARMSGAKIKAFRHNDTVHLEELLQEAVLSSNPPRRVLVLVEGIYSMEGELARLPEIARVAKLYGAYIYLDEAHSIGAVGPTGRGVTEELNVNTDLVDIMMGTFTKSFGSAGGYVAASAELVEEIRQHSAGSNDSVSMSPGCCVQSTQALKVMMGEDGTDVGVTKIRQLRDNSKFFRDGLKNLGVEVLGDYPSPIMPVMLYQPYKIGDFSRLAFEKGLAVVVVGSPAVPLFLPRVRFCLSAAHSREELVDALHKVAEVADELSLRFERKSGRAPFYSSGGTITAMDEGKNKLRVASEAKVESQRAAAMAAVAARGNPPPLGHGPVVASSGGSQRGWHVDGARPECASMNVSAVDFLGLRKDEGMALACLKTVQRVGCGSCSPRGFYGTFPEHVKLEEDIAKFLGVGEAVLYSFGACTVSSVIQALLKPGDVAVVDEGVSFGVLAGLRLCKAQVVFYSHCNGQAAEQALELLEAEDGATSAQLFNSAKKRRRFIVTEAVFSATGQIAPLPALVALRQRYHARIILEESNSFGVLGRTGRGLTEHFDLPVSKVDVIAASLEGAGASVGGFAAGATGVVSYQRLMGSGYVFSAALPPYLATASSYAIAMLQAEPSRLERLKTNMTSLRTKLIKEIPGLTTPAKEGSPVLPVQLAHPSGDDVADGKMLETMARYLQQQGYGASMAHQSAMTGLQRGMPLVPTLRVFASAAHTKGGLKRFVDALSTASLRAQGPWPAPSPEKVLMARMAPKTVRQRRAMPASASCTAFDLDFNPMELDAVMITSELQEELNMNLGSDTDEGEISPSSGQPPTTRNLAGEMKTWTPACKPVVDYDEVVVEGKEAEDKATFGGEGAGDPVSMTVPLLHLVMLLHRAARRYIIGQISSTERMAPAMLRWLHAEPAKGENLYVATLYVVVNFLASRKFYMIAGPTMLWVAGCTPSAALLVLCYCLNCVVGCMLKSLLLTNASKKHKRTRYGTGRMHSWPSVAAVNATAIPFLLLRMQYGSQYVWDMDTWAQCTLAYTLGIAWLVLVSTARIRAGDSPADVQGGVVVGALTPRLMIALMDPLKDWLVSGDWRSTETTSLLVVVAMVVALFPMPLRSNGEVFRDALACYHRTAVMLSFMLTFTAGTLMCTQAKGAMGAAPQDPVGGLYFAVMRLAVGSFVTLATMLAVSKGMKRCMQKFLQCFSVPATSHQLLTLEQKQADEQQKGISRAMHRGCMEAVIVSRAAAFGVSVSFLAPVAFHLVGI